LSLSGRAARAIEPFISAMTRSRIASRTSRAEIGLEAAAGSRRTIERFAQHDPLPGRPAVRQALERHSIVFAPGGAWPARRCSLRPGPRSPATGIGAEDVVAGARFGAYPIEVELRGLVPCPGTAAFSSATTHSRMRTASDRPQSKTKRATSNRARSSTSVGDPWRRRCRVPWLTSPRMYRDFAQKPKKTRHEAGFIVP
jgi:hypothetical protein